MIVLQCSQAPRSPIPIRELEAVTRYQLVAASLYKELNWSQKVLQIFIPVKIIWSQFGNSGYLHSTPIHEPMAYHFM